MKSRLTKMKETIKLLDKKIDNNLKQVVKMKEMQMLLHQEIKKYE